jgi:hypothetical protein
LRGKPGGVFAQHFSVVGKTSDVRDVLLDLRLVDYEYISVQTVHSLEIWTVIREMSNIIKTVRSSMNAFAKFVASLLQSCNRLRSE